MTVQRYELTAIAGLLLLSGTAAVMLVSGRFELSPLLSVMGILCFWLAAQFWLVKHAPSVDALLLPIAFFLTAVGLIFIFRIKPQLFYAQIIWSIIGTCAFCLVAWQRKHLYMLNSYKYTIGLFGILLLLATLLFGVEIGGNKNWIILGPVRFQPSEFAKLFIILFISGYLSSRQIELVQSLTKIGPLELPHFRFLAPLIAVWGLAMLILVIQRDLGASLLFFGTTLILTCIASTRWAIALIGMLFFVTGSTLAYKFFPHVGTRIDIWLSPWADPNGKSYQLLQSLFALGSGGVFGTGIASGQPDLIPEVHTDFIFSAIGEETGFMGATCILILYLILLYRAFRVALHSRNIFGSLTSTGLAILLGLQVFVILAGTTNLLPMTGITLPFISYGGSSLLSSFLLLGTIAALSGEAAV